MFSDTEIGVFLDELDEQIQCINENLLIMEREGENPQALGDIFRAAHTIKGSSAAIGYEKIASLTHEMENLFDQLRKGALPLSAFLVDTLFMSLDALNKLREEITGRNVEYDLAQVVERIKQCGVVCQDPAFEVMSDTGPEELNQQEAWRHSKLETAEEEVIMEAELTGYLPYWIDVEIEPGCQMKSIRAFLIFETLQQAGEIIGSHPPAEEIQEGRFDSGFRVVFLTVEDPEQISNLLMTVSEVKKATLDRIILNYEVNNLKQEISVPSKDTAEQATRTEPPEIKAAQTVRVEVQKLDNLMNLVGELVIDRTRLTRFVEIFKSHCGLSSNELVETLNEISGHLGQITADLQEQIMKARMLPVAQVFNRFPRLVRDLAQKLGKKVNFIVQGHETELDRSIIEIIGSPLIHLIRNALDHGIEKPGERIKMGKAAEGTLELKASCVENHIIITVKDDGRGIDPGNLKAKALEKGLIDQETARRISDREALNLIFMAGFSTSSEINDLSGRGVGMDIVRNQIEQIDGLVNVSSTVGTGTTFTIKLPLTLAIIRSLMVSVGNEEYAFPLTNVVEAMIVPSREIKKVKHSEVILVRGQTLPLLRLSDIFGLKCGGDTERLFVVILGVEDKKAGFVVDKLLGESEIVIKSLGDYIGKVPHISGATILGDGKVALIVDARSLVREIWVDDSGQFAS